MNPTEESFFASKTMILLCIGIGAIMAMILMAVIVKVIWGVDAFQLVAAGVTGVTAHTGQGTYRNVQTDTTLRLAAVTPPAPVPTAPAPAVPTPQGNLSAPVQQ